MRRPNQALISIGSNIEAARWIPEGMRLMRQRFAEVQISPRYGTDAVGGSAGQPSFTNAAVALRTDLHAPALRAALRHLEARCGRVRGPDRFAPRTLDLDLVWLQDQQGQALFADGALTAAAHVLVPAADLWPERVPPGAAATLAALADRLDARVRAGIRPMEDPPA